jgi:hypothetical protein
LTAAAVKVSWPDAYAAAAIDASATTDTKLRQPVTPKDSPAVKTKVVSGLPVAVRKKKPPR